MWNATIIINSSFIFGRKFPNGGIDEKTIPSEDTDRPEAGKFRTILPQVNDFCQFRIVLEVVEWSTNGEMFLPVLHRCWRASWKIFYCWIWACHWHFQQLWFPHWLASTMKWIRMKSSWYQQLKHRGWVNWIALNWRNRKWLVKMCLWFSL